MKVEQESVAFLPVTITLETNEECRMFASIMQHYTNYPIGSTERTFYINLINELDQKDW